MPHTAATPSVIIASKKAGSEQKPPVPVMQVIIPADMSKEKDFSGTKFIRTKQTAHSKGSCPFDEIIAGDKVPLAVPNLFGATLFGVDSAKRGAAALPADADKKKASISCDLAQCGALGLAVEILDTEFHEQVKAPATLAKLWTDADKRPQFPSPVKRFYGKKAKEERRGKPRENIVIEFKMPFGRFPASFKERAGMPKTSVYNWATRSVDSKGEETFEEWRDESGATFSPANFEKIVLPGDIIRRIHLIIERVSIYNDGISFSLSVFKIWTERGATSGNVLGDDEPAPAATSAAASAAPRPAIPAAPKSDVFVGDDESEGDGEGEGEDEDGEGLH